MRETLYALCDVDGVVTNVIVAEKAFIDFLPNGTSYINVTDTSAGIGWKRVGNEFSAPVLSAEAVAAQQAAQAAIASDIAFITALKTKIKNGGVLTPTERDRALIIQISMGLGI
jgi:hypothetical protein